MNMEKFVSAYMTSLCTYLAPHGFEPKALSENMWQSIAKMRKNDGSQTNEEAFWNEFTAIYGEKAEIGKKSSGRILRKAVPQGRGRMRRQAQCKGAYISLQGKGL